MSDFRQQMRAHYEAQSLPPDKVAAIVNRAGAAAADEKESAAERAKVTPFPDHRRRWKAALAIAAGVALLFGVVSMLNVARRPSVSYAQLAPRVVEFFGGAPELPKHSQDKAALHAWLVAQGAPADFQIPAPLLPLESFGCEVLKVQGSPAYLTCFWREKNADGSGAKLVHLLVAKRSDFRDTPPPGEMQRRELPGWSFASWSQGKIVYTLATAGPPSALDPFVSAPVASRSAAAPLAALSF